MFPADYKNHNDLPLARIKRIMKSDEDVRMISAEAPVLFAKACELFILDMALRWVLCFVLLFLVCLRVTTYSQEHMAYAGQRSDAHGNTWL